MDPPTLHMRKNAPKYSLIGLTAVQASKLYIVPLAAGQKEAGLQLGSDDLLSVECSVEFLEKLVS